MAVRIGLDETEGVLRKVVLVRWEKPARAQQMAVDIAANDPFGQPVGRHMRRGRIVGANSGGVVGQRLPEPADVLAKLAHHHVAAVETKVEGALRRPLLRQVRGAGQQIVRHQRTGRVFGMGIEMAQQDLAQRHAMPRIARSGLAVAEDDRIVLAAIVGAERDRLRQAVGESEMLAGDALGVELQVERELVDDLHVVSRERRLDRIGPVLDGFRVLVIEQQQGVHGRGRDHLTRRLSLVRAAQRPIVLHRRVAAPTRPAVDDGALPLVLDPVAQAAQPVFLVHALAKRLRKTRQRLRRQPRFLQARPGEGDAGRALVLAVAVGDGRNRGKGF